MILLGEAGIGKSITTKQAFEQVLKAKEEALWFELGDYTSSDLSSEVFKDDKFKRWKEGTHRLHLFLDSLDEGLLSIDNLSRILSRELRKLKQFFGEQLCDRLFFRITCRTSEWRSSLEEDLKQLWGENNLKVYELAPLRRMDVAETARINNLVPDTFLWELVHKDAVPLAIKPNTLNFLLETYKADGQLTVIIEVKGCWNKDLDNAMETQLVNRYLKDNTCQHGLYLIGWFNCKQWDKKDSRKPPKIKLEKAREKFEAQAAELSQQGVKVRAFVLNTALR